MFRLTKSSTEIKRVAITLNCGCASGDQKVSSKVLNNFLTNVKLRMVSSLIFRMKKVAGVTVLVGLLKGCYSLARSHYCSDVRAFGC